MHALGSSIKVYIIGERAKLTDLLFTLDNTQVGRFTSSIPEGDQYFYDVVALSQDDIPNGDHTLQMQATGDQWVQILFDYAVYT